MKSILVAGMLMVAVAGSASAQPRPKPQLPGIPANQRPPKGMCRIWLKDVAAAQQPAPTDCAAAVKNCPSNGTVIFGDSQDSKVKSKEDPKVEPKSLVGGKKPLPIRKPPITPPA